MRVNLILIVPVIALGLSGCAAYEPAPLTKQHPAHFEAAEAPVRVASLTLAYTAAQPEAVNERQAAAADHSGHGGMKEAAGKSVQGEGKVIAIVPSASQVVLEHGEIKGFMDAMTMGYKTEPASLLSGVKAGDQVRFTIDVEKKAIVKIEKMP